MNSKDEKYFHKKEVEIPIYGRKFVVVLTNDTKEVQKHLPDCFSEDELLYAHAVYGNWKKRAGYIAIFDFDRIDPNERIGIIAHEAVHITHMLAEHRGFVSDFKNDEPIAYLVEWFSNEIYKFANKHGKI